MYGNLSHIPVSLMDLIHTPSGVCTLKYALVLYVMWKPSHSRCIIDRRFSISFLTNHTWEIWPNHPFLLETMVPALNPPLNMVPVFWHDQGWLRVNTWWKYEQMSRYRWSSFRILHALTHSGLLYFFINKPTPSTSIPSSTSPLRSKP